MRLKKNKSFSKSSFEISIRVKIGKDLKKYYLYKNLFSLSDSSAIVIFELGGSFLSFFKRCISQVTLTLRFFSLSYY